MLQPPVRSAYVHVPFCRHRCGYCNFTLITGRDDLIDAYLRALDAELASHLAEPTDVDTIFLGGGTPSYLASADLERLLATVSQWLLLNSDGEFSVEMNPLDCTPERLHALKSGGVNRISLGGQSFSVPKLKTLERDHTGEQLADSLVRCQEAFGNVSLDLIFAAPGESLETWCCDVERSLGSPIQHLSTYGLTVERGSAFYSRVRKGNLREADAELQLSMYEQGIKMLKAAGWDHYEVSSFAKPGKRCRHNETYWRGQPWFAFGPGAASFLPLPDRPGHFVRQVNHRSSTNYIRKQLAGECSIAESEIIGPEQYYRERIVFGLRRLEGISLSSLRIELGDTYEPLVAPVLAKYVDQGWLQLNSEEQLKLTPQGLVLSDSLWPDLLFPNE